MGCAVSKGASLGSPGYEVSSAASGYEVVSGSASASASATIWSRPVRLEALDLGGDGEGDEDKGARGNAVGGTARPGNLHRYIESEQAAAGWPAWLSAVAAEAVQGWIGQGTYSSVFRARSLETGRLVALKKVRFDSVEPESVRFMAREIIVLRRLQGHPNVIGLHGLITSRSSACIYLVFEYMEHDLAGLASSPDLSFSEPQIKCYMRQLLAGLEHCHARGVMHRDIKCANLLVSSDGVLKVADFGLANLAASTGFAWAKKPRVPDAATTKRSAPRGPRSTITDGGDAASARTTAGATTGPYEAEKQEMIKQWAQVAEAFTSSEAYNSRSTREPLDAKQLKTSKKHKGKMKRVDYSGPLLSEPRHVDELLQSHEQRIRRAGRRRTWFHKGNKKEQQH
ncbi:unnamed protein product [Triticum turgidum subsp. durum]|uniref:[RNA-polymerase]-subunit kinase n=1 Tax=Triticum turgidum subsp. durum TaxID=4567 RepID=A0A9R0WKI8_TRITD|nr:unnamed protein product [Triticum turgidum subsp. durum]